MLHDLRPPFCKGKSQKIGNGCDSCITYARQCSFSLCLRPFILRLCCLESLYLGGRVLWSLAVGFFLVLPFPFPTWARFFVALRDTSLYCMHIHPFKIRCAPFMWLILSHFSGFIRFVYCTLHAENPAHYA